MPPGVFGKFLAKVVHQKLDRYPLYEETTCLPQLSYKHFFSKEMSTGINSQLPLEYLANSAPIWVLCASSL